ncbi:hypothetical protein [Blastococcus xanthinilyticus]|uniref:Uncharacterized protein n=1 Tax=Blastococcus xanthinilyticus TaxID=1564164 RepID=A0A5S5CZZ7_9ACTN|nr:hypothetical protein [Blastococcus xanthinilyticus]TYP88112.1 hypothetical protein BD833_105288 [Blastococcus xanthinilyticus]
MTIPDSELEAGLRNLRARADLTAPPPADLAERTRARYRAQRRSRTALGAGALVVLAVVVGVPVAASGLLSGDRGGEVAVPSSPAPEPAPALYDLPTRGSLAGDEEWVAGVRELDWIPPELADQLPTSAELPEPPVGSRRVAWAGEVAGTRVALVLGRAEQGFVGGSGQEGLVQTWFTGDGDAAPEEMAPVGYPGSDPGTGPAMLFAAPYGAPEQRMVVVVGAPGDEAVVLTGRTVTASADVVDRWEPVPMEEGAGALALGASSDWPTGIPVELSRPGESRPLPSHVTTGEDLVRAWNEPVEIADPRGLRGLVQEDVLQQAVQQLAGRYGLPLRDLRPTLLAAGSVGTGSDSLSGEPETRTLLVGLTFPSGATGAAFVDYWTDSYDMAQEDSFGIVLAPAGTPLLEQVFAVATASTVTVSGPASGVLAEIYLADGTLHATVPLVDGAGVGPLAPPAAERVRILDGRGAVVAEAPLSELEG